MRLRALVELYPNLFRVFVCAVMVISPVVVVLQSHNANAEQITSRSLTLMSGAAHGTPSTIDGGSSPGGNVRHRFAFSLPTSGTLLSIKFRYCTQPGANSDTCTRPTDLDLSGINETADIEVQTINGSAGGFILQSPAPTNTDDSFYITRGSGTNNASDPVIVQVKDIINPSTINTTFFVRISTYTSADASGTPVDYGVVAASTSRDIVLTGTMPESLVFCAAENITMNGSVPDCAAATDGSVLFNQLFSPSTTSWANSKVAASTNAASGYNISVMGPTLTSGTNTITAMTSAGTSAVGTSQFGMNMRENTITGYGTPVGADVSPAYDVPTKYLGQASGDYSTPGTYKFTPTSNYSGSNEVEISRSGDNVAGATGATNAQIFTATYIVNVPGSQAAGSYTTTLTYICTANF